MNLHNNLKNNFWLVSIPRLLLNKTINNLKVKRNQNKIETETRETQQSKIFNQYK